MNNIFLAAGFVLIVALAAYIYVQSQRPRHTFWAIDFGHETVQPYNRKTLTGHLTVPGPGGKKVRFPLETDWSMDRRDGKGSVMWGDINTGQLVKPTREGGWLGMDGIMLEYALADGRVQSLANATHGTGLTLKHILYALIAGVALIILVVYQFARNGGL